MLAPDRPIRSLQMHKGRIVGETEDKYFVKLEGETYSIIFSHHEFIKSEIFTIIDDQGILRYPKSLTLVEEEIAPMSDEEFQRMIASRQLEIMQDQASSIHTISTILGIQLLISIGAIVVMAISSS